MLASKTALCPLRAKGSVPDGPSWNQFKDPAVTVLTVNTAVFEVTPPGSTTAILTVPAEAIRPASTDAVNCVALTNVVGSVVPLHCTTAPETNPLPFTVSVKAAPPAGATFGLRLVIDGGALIVKGAPVDVTPPLVTVIVAVPAEAIRLLVTVAVNWVTLKNVVTSTVPFHCTTAPAANPLPFTVNVNSPPPAVADGGLKLLIVGRGLIVNETPVDVTPLLVTVIVAVPAAAIRLLLTVAVNCVAFTNVVGNDDPFHCATAPAANPLPFTVNENPPPPAVADEGLKLLIVGRGLIVNETPVDVIPTLVTVIATVPAAAIRLLLTVAVNCVAFTNIVGSDDPLHCTTAPAANPLPFTVNVNPTPPAVADEGLKLLIVGVAPTTPPPLASLSTQVSLRLK
ncbi:MAG: hypothetical protein ABSG79_13635 [Bryobacteraceae bacterium]